MEPTINNVINNFGEGNNGPNGKVWSKERITRHCVLTSCQILFESCIKSSKKTNVGWFLELGINTY
jgi:hypothetical protein